MTPSATDYRRALGQTEAELLLGLAEKKKAVFTTDDARDLLASSAKEAIRGLVKKKWVLRLRRGLFVVVPLDMGIKGSDVFVMHEYVLAGLLAKDYYIGYWSALNYHGLTDQIPRTTFVATTEARHSMQVLDSPFRFVKVSGRKFFGWREYEVSEHKTHLSDPEKTIADCLDHPEYCGGIEQIARAIYFCASEISMSKVVDAARRMGNRSIMKRLGYILDTLDLIGEHEESFVDFTPSEGYVKLDMLSPSVGRYNERWKLLVNYHLDPETWMY
jgi:predicted transcriptional regulator of viral defense system